MVACPFLEGRDCLREDCELWDSINEACSFKILAGVLIDIRDVLRIRWGISLAQIENLQRLDNEER